MKKNRRGARNLTLFFLLMLCGMFCNGCALEKPGYYEKVKLMTKEDYQSIGLVNDLKEVGVKVLFHGNNFSKKSLVQIFISESSLFNAGSANFNEQANKIMDRVVMLMNCYEKDTILVRGNVQTTSFDDNAKRYTKVLTLARAHRIVQYLWSQDIDGTLAYADNDATLPEYIEISFQKLKYSA